MALSNLLSPTHSLIITTSTYL